MSEDPRRFRRISNLLSVLLCAGCAAAFVWSWIGTPGTRGFPAVFLCAGLLNLVQAAGKFRRDKYRVNQKTAGFFHLLGGIFFIALAVISLICLLY